jgi:K+-sensing histidine kinase KdpD
MIKVPIPENEMDRLMSLSEFDLDYDNLEDNFKDLTKLAAKVAGTEISLINLIDSFTQWTISSHGLDIEQMPREESVCQYVIAEDNIFEVKDLSIDERFKERDYVTGAPNLRYYLGLPLKTNDGFNIGALCVLDTYEKTISPEKIELLKIISNEIVSRLTALKIIEGLKGRLHEVTQTHKKVAHDIRGPLGGIIGLAQIISEQGDDNKIDEVLQFINLIQKSGNSLLELADEILSVDQEQKLGSDQFNLNLLKEKLLSLYLPQAVNKQINFTINTNTKVDKAPFSKNKLLQIVGNLVSNAMKFTPANGSITVDLDFIPSEKDSSKLLIKVTDSGVGLNQDGIDAILSGTAKSTHGTSGENGYGFGLALVKHLIESLKGSLKIESKPNQGATFIIELPQK